jgi:hypothetical protein
MGKVTNGRIIRGGGGLNPVKFGERFGGKVREQASINHRSLGDAL